MKAYLLGLSILFFSILGNTSSDPKAHSLDVNRVSDTQIELQVSGLACESCVKKIKKSFGKNENVESTSVDLKTKKVSLVLRKGTKLSDEQISAIVEKAGFKVN